MDNKRISIFSNGIHLECRETLVDTILKREETIPVNFGLIWFIFRGKILNVIQYDVRRTDGETLSYGKSFHNLCPGELNIAHTN